MKKLYWIIGLILLLGVVGAVAVGTVYTAQQFVRFNLDTYDFELTQAGFRITPTDYVWDINAVTAKKFFNAQGEWNGRIETIGVEKSYSYSKIQYQECRRNNTAQYCKQMVIGLIKEEIYRQIEDERIRLKNLQQDANRYINGEYDQEWGNGSLGDLQ
jgi:hypothetical protein